MIPADDRERDFVAWTEDQASLLREMPSGAFGLDTESLAEEIEDLGRSEIRETSSLLRQLLVHLIKLAVQPNAPSSRHWVDEVLTFQGDAVLACSAGIRQRVDVSSIWRLASNAARRSMAPHGILFALPPECPFTVDELLDDEFDPAAAIAAIGAAGVVGREG